MGWKPRGSGRFALGCDGNLERDGVGQRAASGGDCDRIASYGRFLQGSDG